MDWDIDIVTRLFAAALLGAVIGWERELMNRSAGLRTHILVSLGSALFTILSLTAFHEIGKTNDPARVAAQVVSGIGFLGAGTIIKQGVSVRGLTSAATMWVVAAIGMAAGAACYVGALVTTLLSLLTLIRLRGFELEHSHHRLYVNFTIVKAAEGLRHIQNVVAALKITLLSFDIKQEGEETHISATVTAPEEIDRTLLAQKLIEAGIKHLEISC